MAKKKKDGVLYYTGIDWGRYDCCRRKKPTKKELAEQKAKELKEKRRRAKKITMTVGEYEDALQQASDQASDDYEGY